MKTALILVLSVGVGAWLAGCVPPEPAQPRTQLPGQPAAEDEHAGHEHAAESGAALNAPPVELAAETPTPKAGPSPAEVKKLEIELDAKPEDADLKDRTAEANFALGDAFMNDPDLPPRIKYRTALKYLRRALTLNPTHAKAQADRQAIEEIYQSMGMPIPE